MRSILILISIPLFLIFCGSTLVAQPGKSVGQEVVPETIHQLQTAIENILKQTGTHAAGIAMVSGDSITWVAGLGKANVEKNMDANENTMFRIGSVSKMFVSLAILKLQEEGRLSLKDKVRDLIPDIEFHNPWEKTNPVLVEHLLEHTTGWDDAHVTDYALNDPKMSLKAVLDFHPHTRTSRWVPGARMAYCNSGPAVAAYIVEKITGKKFEDFVQEQFFNPMGMESMTYFESDTYKRLGAALYSGNTPLKYWNIGHRPSGSINASPKDMAKMLRFFIGRGKAGGAQLISEASLKRMETPESSIGAKAGLEYGYGLSNYSSTYKSFVYRGHNGGVAGGLSEFVYLPGHSVGYCVMINSANGNTLRRISNVIREVQTRGFNPDRVERKKIREVPDIGGYYVSINPRIAWYYFLERITGVRYVQMVNGSIFIGKQKFQAVTAQQFADQATGKIAIVRAKDPLAGDVLQQDTTVLKKVPTWIVFMQSILAFLWVIYFFGSTIVGGIRFIRYFLKKRPAESNIRIWIWPYVTSMTIWMIWLLVIFNVKDSLNVFGKMNFVSVSVMILTIFFAVTSLWSVIHIFIHRNSKMKRTIYWHLVILSSLHFILAWYLLYFGMIGAQTWG